MITDNTESGHVRIWLNRDELDTVLGQFDDDTEPRKRAATSLMGFAGLRSHEVTRVRYADIHRDEKGRYLLTVDGKDTRGGDADAKQRTTVCPDFAERELLRAYSEQDIDENTSLIDVSTRTLRRWVSDGGDRAADATGDNRWRDLSTHDLRRSWGHYLMEEGVGLKKLQQMGGWSDIETMEQYLTKSSAESLADEVEGVWS